MMYRAVIFWVNLALRLVFWGGILVVGFWVYNRGPEGFVEDVQGLEGQLDQIEKRIAELRAAARQQVEESSA